MLDHPVVDIALGLFWLYLVLSLTASAVQEWIAGVVGLRASNLRAGLRSLLGDDYARRLYEHPLVRNLGKKNPFFRSLVSKSKEDCYKTRAASRWSPTGPGKYVRRSRRSGRTIRSNRSWRYWQTTARVRRRSSAFDWRAGSTKE